MTFVTLSDSGPSGVDEGSKQTRKLQKGHLTWQTTVNAKSGVVPYARLKRSLNV